MTCASLIRRHIARLAEDEIFTTREMLSYGSRSAVDQSLYSLVQVGMIQRLASGVFVRKVTRTHSALEIATIKARAFGKQLFKHASTIASEWGIIKETKQDPIFSVIGSSSTLWFGETRIRLKGIAPRKVRLGETKVGQVIMVLWYLGKRAVNLDVFQRVTLKLSGAELDLLRTSCAWMPDWITRFVVRRRLRTKYIFGPVPRL